MIDPILREIPMPITTPRLVLRNAFPGDGEKVNAAVLESLDQLRPWMPWAQTPPTVEESEIHARKSYAKWLLREDLQILLFEKSTGSFVGGSGLHRINWSVPSFEIGYWCRTSMAGRGYIQESTNAITRFAFSVLGAKRVEIRCDSRNARSLAVMRKLGFTQDALLRNQGADAISGLPKDTYVYSRLDSSGLPDLTVSW